MGIGSGIGPEHGGVEAGGKFGLAFRVARHIRVDHVGPGAGGTGRYGFAAELVMAISKAVGALGAVVQDDVFAALLAASIEEEAVECCRGAGVANNESNQ